MSSGSLRPLEDAIRTHQGSAHSAIPAMRFPAFKPKSHHFVDAKSRKILSMMDEGFSAALKNWR